MTGTVASVLALTLYLAGLAAAFGVRSWIHRRRTGSVGFRGLTGAPGSAEWWGGLLFAAALVLGATGPALALAGTTPPWPTPTGFQWAGLAITVASLFGVLASQSGMGASWRIGVDATEPTDLVTTGAFALVRNPIFTAMVAALAGIALLAPTPVSAAAPLILLVAVELQVRCVEEPYLLRTHGDTYAHYAARVGRFLPGIGRLENPSRDLRRDQRLNLDSTARGDICCSRARYAPISRRPWDRFAIWSRPRSTAGTPNPDRWLSSASRQRLTRTPAFSSAAENRSARYPSPDPPDPPPPHGRTDEPAGHEHPV